MKTLTTLIIVSLLSSTASASFYQITCTSADGMTKSSNGHVENFTIVTEVNYKNNNRVETPIKIDYTNHELNVIDSKSLHSENRSACDSESGSGFSSWKNTNFQRVRITKTDGSLFSPKTVGVSQDGKTVTANMICEEDGNSQIFCGE